MKIIGTLQEIDFIKETLFAITCDDCRYCESCNGESKKVCMEMANNFEYEIKNN